MKVTVLLVLLFCACTAYSRFVEPRFGFGYESRVVGGVEAKPHSAPYIVSLQSNSRHFCAGSLINKQTVVTAAHCVLAAGSCSRITVIAGLHNLRDTSDVQKRQTSGCVIHEKYAGGVAPYDIALISLSEPVEVTEKVKPIALPENEKIHEGEVVLFGWGSTSTSPWPNYPNLLQTVKKPIVEYKECERILGPGNTPLHPTNVCTGPLSGGKSACSGDSGGPLTQQNENGSVELVGIVSWGYIPCGRPYRPSVYGRVSAFIDWIDENKF